MSEPAAAGYLIRPATEDDLDAIVGFEIDIALVSFGDTAITDPALHRKRVSGALGKPGEITLVAAAAAAPDTAVGWAWLSARTNSLTGDRYGNFRSLAAAAGPDRSLIGELLLGAVVAAADEHGAAPADRQGPGRQSRHAGAVPEIRLRGGAPDHGAAAARRAGSRPMIKCVIWDIDNTLLTGVYLESPDQPPPADPAMAGVLAELSSRGIIHALASRNPPEAAGYAAAAVGHEFAAAECGWGRKSDAIRSILTELGLTPDAAAFVDDEAHERAEVSFALPDLLVLSGEDMADAAGWPEFGPAVVTPEARRRGAMYAQRRRRQEEARGFGGSREEFLRYCGTAITIAWAQPPDVPRLHELSVRTHQFNSTGAQVSEAALSALLGRAGSRVATVGLSDRFGDDGLVGGCVIDTGRRGLDGDAADDVVPRHRPGGHRCAAGLAGRGSSPGWRGRPEDRLPPGRSEHAAAAGPGRGRFPGPRDGRDR